MSLYYLAHAYRHKDRVVELDRISKATETVGSLIRYGIKNKIEIKVFAPITHNDPVYKTSDFTPEEMKYVFKTFDFHVLGFADAMIILTLPGWKESVGVTGEIEFCKANNKPVHYLDFEDRNNDEKLKIIFGDLLDGGGV